MTHFPESLALRVIAAFVALALGAGACSRSSDEPGTTSSAVVTTSSTSVVVTTEATTTTTRPPPTVSVDLAGAPAGLAPVVEGLYRWVVDREGSPAPAVPAGLRSHLTPIEVDASLRLRGSASSAKLPRSGEVAVAILDDDVVLAVGEGGEWRVVGAKLARFGSGPWYGGSPRTVLVVGSDARWNEDVFSGRGDSIHILATAPDLGGGAIVGIPRDAWIERPDGTKAKYTNVLAVAGPGEFLATTRGITGLPLEGYLVTGFLGFEILVDDFGAFELDLPAPIRGGLPGFPDFPAGVQTLDGPTLLLLSRIRKTLPGGDFDRSLNQGLIMTAALRVVQERGIGELPALLALLLESTWTDLDDEALLTMAATAYELRPDAVTNVIVPGEITAVRKASVVILGDQAAAIFEDLTDGVLGN